MCSQPGLNACTSHPALPLAHPLLAYPRIPRAPAPLKTLNTHPSSVSGRAVKEGSGNEKKSGPVGVVLGEELGSHRFNSTWRESGLCLAHTAPFTPRPSWGRTGRLQAGGRAGTPPGPPWDPPRDPGRGEHPWEHAVCSDLPEQAGSAFSLKQNKLLLLLASTPNPRKSFFLEFCLSISLHFS